MVVEVDPIGPRFGEEKEAGSSDQHTEEKRAEVEMYRVGSSRAPFSAATEHGMMAKGDGAVVSSSSIATAGRSVKRGGGGREGRSGM